MSWVWPDRIPLGKVTVIGGDPGVGKSMLTAGLAGHVSTGTTWPDGTTTVRGHVLILSAEDDPEDTTAASANLDLVTLIPPVIRVGERRASLSLRDHLSRLDVEVPKIGGVRLVIVDPIGAYLGATESHRDADVRAVLAPVAEWAARRGLTLCLGRRYDPNESGREQERHRHAA